ncbi:PilC/PilY family type IV pilus protein [Halopseudomonas salegens]|uniref:Type IV pilus assembly protein PilY1 n=1 Tax=Halopseudomonas salegens TaxID=1434072 RepID=A0A1H2ECJ3_9GAMM|nr:PilC/PilY family type IV pilus protein [Halopseudomonas salegens]SDT92478.1 type IV pilus assembly protein PilY1 [Halopseudomonas salegens]
MKLMTHIIPAALMTMAVAITPSSLLAEDIEVYYSEVLSDDSVNKNIANVMIMLDTSGSMRNCEAGSGSNWCTGNDWRERRINLLHEAMEGILDDADENVKIGLGRFNSDSDGGYIMLPVMTVNEKTRSLYDDALSSINPSRDTRYPSGGMPSGGTPTSLAYEEMARYMLGGSRGEWYGADGGQFCIEDEYEEQCTTDVEYSDGVEVDSCDTNEPGCSINLGSWQNLPVSQSCDTGDDNCRFFWSGWRSGSCPSGAVQCQSYYGWYHNLGIYQQRSVTYTQSEVLNEVTYCEMVKTGDCAEYAQIADGSSYKSPIVEANQCESNHIILFTDGAPSGDDPGDVDLVSCSGGSYNCQVKIANYLNSDNNSANRQIKTHNIGLYMGDSTLNNMQSVSSAGGGATYNSDNAASLLLAFKQTLDLIADEANTMVSPGVAVSQSERFQHLDEMYFSLFKPLQSSFWQGNLKRYRVDVNDGEADFYDVNGNNAMDGEVFSPDARSWWSTSADGADVVKGGARDRLQATSRRLFYSPSPGGTLRQFDLSDFSNSDLLLPAEATDAVRGNVANELMNMWGDPLHSRPIMVNYGGATVGEEFVEDNVVFVSTNAGMLHAIDTSNGDEKFAFMPHEIISKASSYTVNRLPLASGNKRQTYGLDGTWTAWRQRGATLEDPPSKVMIYGGMRRGGNQYYALNVTNVSSPTLAWQISGGTGDFKDLGQTWSTPKVARFPDGAGGSIPVVIFGGGYSPEDHDDHMGRQSQDAKGNAIYVVNADTGELVWSAGGRSSNVTTHVSTMTHAIPGSVAVDLDSNGVANHLYYADLGGQVFRADLDTSADKAHSVTRLAAVGGTGANHRRFFEQPTVAYVRDGASSALFVTMVSGYRAHPLDVATQEGIFVLRDQGPFGRSAEAVANIGDFSNVAGGSLPDYTKRGWYYPLNQSEGEKGLSSPAVFDYEVLFTTYAPNADSGVERDPCSVNYGQSYLHRVDLKTGQGERYALDQPGLPPGVTVLFGEDGDTAIVVGTEAIPVPPACEGDDCPEPECPPGEKCGLESLRHGRWMQLTPDAAGAIKLPEDEEEGTGD